MTEQSDTPPVTPLGFSEWSSENPYDDPLESRLKYGDYLREEYIEARAYNPTVEGQIKEGFTLSLQQEGILSSDGENAEEIEQRISDLEKGSSFDQRARSFYQSLSPNDPDQQSFKDYLQASSVEAPSAEYLEELQPLKEKVESTLNTRQDENFRSQVESGELPIARLSDGEILVGENAEKMGLVSALKASSRANISMRDALSVMPQLETPDGHKLPLYKLKKIVSAVNLLEEEREQNPDFAIQLDGLSTAQAEKEFDTGDKILKTLEAVPRFGRSLLSRIMGQEEAFDKAEQRRKAVEEARGIDHSQLAAKYALKFNMRPDDMEAAMKQIIHDNAMQKQMFKSYDKDDEVGKNLRFGGFGLPSMPLPAMLNKDVYDKTLAAHPNLSPSVKDMLDKQRVNVLKSEFTTMDKFLSSQDSVSEDWNQSLMIGRRAGVPDYKILEGFVADEDNYNVFKERAAGVGASIVNGFLLPFAGVAAAFGLDPAKDYLASVSQKNADRRQLASVFGEDFPFLQDVAETAFPMFMDVAATGLLAGFTAPMGGTGALAYASLKAGGKTSASLAAKGVVKAITSNQFRRQAGKSAFEQAEDLIQKGLVKGSPEGAVQLLKTYNGTLAQKLGIAPAVFIPAATRSGSATYGAVYNQLKQNPDITEEEAHDRSLGAMLMAGTFTGVLTSAFSLIGKGGLEDALLKGLTPKDMRVVARGITGRLDGDLLSSAQKAIKATMKKYAFGGLKGVAKNVVDEGVEEGIDEFVNGMITDVALHEDTPMLERMQQTWHAVALGGVMGGSVPAVQLGLKSIRPAITRSNQMAQFYDDIINEAVADLNANGSPITAKAFQEAVSDMKRKDARAAIPAAVEPTPDDAPETPLPSGITSDPQMELALQDKVNPDSVASAIADVMADKASVATNANPATMEIKGALMNRMNMPAGSSSYVENADHQSVRDLISPTPAPPVIEEALPPQRSKILDPRRVGEAGAIEARFGKRVAEINRAKDLYVKMNREASSAEVAGESSVGRALRKRIQEGKAVSPEQAEELIGQAFKDRVKALSNLKIDSDVTLDEVTEAPDEIEAIDNLIASGFRHVITPAKLKRLGIPVNQRTTSDAFIRSANAKIAEGIKSKFLRISYSPLEGDIPMNSAYGDGKIFVNRFGVGMFNNDPLDMLTFLERGIPVVVDKNVRSFIKNQINPSFRFTEFNDKIFVSDIVIPESGGLVSAVTPMDRVLSLQPDYTRLVKLTERVVNLRAKGLADPEGMVTSPFNPDEKISNQDILDRLESNESVAPFLAPSKGELAPEFTEAALLELRLSSMEALFEGTDFSGYSSLPSAGRRIADAYVSEQESRLAHQKESFVSTLSVDEVSELEGDPDFNPEVEAEDTYVPPQEEIAPPFAPARITAAYKEVQANAVAAMTADSALRRRIVGIVQNEVFQTTNIDFNRTTNKTLWGHLVNWMAQGNAKSNSISLLFQKELRTRQFDMAAPVRDALRLMGLTSNSIEGTPKSDADYLSLIKDTVENIKGEPATDLETLNFFNYVKQSVRTLFLRSQPHNMGKGYVQMLNNDAIAALGLESGNPDSIIEALNRIAGLSQRAQKEYDTHLVSLARLLLQSPNFIKTIELSIDETNQPYAGKFDRLSDGIPAISLNINGHNPRGLADTLLHELIHAYVTNITGKPESARTPQETAAIQTLEATISELKKDYAAMGSEYAIRNVITTPSSRLPNLGVFSFNDSRINDALANVDEFVAHFLTSTDFQQFVKTMTGDRGPAVYSAFQRIIMAIRSFFRGATPRFDAAFSAVLDLSHSSVLEAGARRRKKKDLITVNEFLALPNKKSKQAVDFIEESVFPFTPVSENTIPKEPITPDTVVHTITKGVSTAQQEQADLSSAIQEATGVDATAKKEEGDAYERIVRYLKGAVIPPEVRTEVSETIPQMAKMNNDTGVLTINPKKLNGLMVDLQRRNAGRKVPPETLRGIISVVINEEIAHAASVAAITRTEQQEIIGAMTIADAYKAIDEYGDDSAGAASMREKMKEKWRAGDPTTQIQVMEEMLRQHADRATNGFSTEEDVAFLRTNPSILQYVIRYFQRFLKKLGYYRSRKNISPELNTAINRVVNELRALKLGFRSLSNIKTFDADNPLAVLELLKKQAGMNKSVDQPDEQELAVASGITLTGRDLNLEAVKGAESLGVQERDKFTGLVYTAVDPADLGFTDLISETIEAGEDPMFPAFAVEAREGFTKSFLDAPDQEIKPHVYLRHIVVPNEFRSKGVGRAMLKALLRKMDEAGSDIALFFKSTDRRGIEGKQLYDFYASEGFTEIEDIFIGRMINDPESWIKREFERWKDIRDNQYEDEIEFFSHSGDKIISYSLYDMSDVRLMEVMREYHAAKVAYAYDEGFDLRRPAQPLEQGTLDLGSGITTLSSGEEVSAVWDLKGVTQKIGSQDTSLKQIGALFTHKMINWVAGTVNADIGGGKYDLATEHLADKGVTNYVYDPFSRPDKKGIEEVVSKIHGGQADTATLSNVLNVIKEKGARRRALQQANDAVKEGGTIYITVHRDPKKKEGATPRGYQLHRPLKEYLGEISEVLEVVSSTNQLIVAKPRKATALGSGIMAPVTRGVYINSKTQPFTDQILSGEKTIETRSKPTLDTAVGERVGIIRSGRGTSVVVGYATIGERIAYDTVEAFRADEDKHLVKKGSEFDTKGKKYGYPLLDVSREANPYPVKRINYQFASITPPSTTALGSGIMVDTAEDLSAVDAPLDISALDIKPAARFRTATGDGPNDRAEDSTFENYARQKSYVLNAPTVAGYQIFKGRKNRKGRAVEARGEDTAAYKELKYLNDRHNAVFAEKGLTKALIDEIKSVQGQDDYGDPIYLSDGFIERIGKKLYVDKAKAKTGQVPYTGDEAQMEILRGLIQFVRDTPTRGAVGATKKWRASLKRDFFDKMRPLADEVYEGVHKGMVENLVHLHDTMHPEIRERAKLWYEGANRIAQDFATRYNITTGQAAATIAVLSPQKDWFQNVSLAGRVMEVVSKQQETVFDKEMADAFIEMSQNIPKTGLTAAAHAKKKAQAKKDAEAMVVIMEGKTLAQLIEEAASFEPEPQKKGESDKAFKKRSNAERARMRPLPARFVRTFDYLNHPKGYAIITPEGNRVQLQRTKNGEIAKVGWGSYPEIQKAVDSFLTDDPEVHSDLLGNQHKVRNFRNNIADPTNIMDGTVDTHAVGATLMLPVAGASDEVSHNFGSAGISSAGNKELGMMGVYAMFLRAHQDAAAFINGRDGTNLSTREIQSITWEQVRTLFTAEQKREAASYAKKGDKETVLDESRKIWNKTNDDGEARNLIEERFGGYGLPDWATPVERSLVARDKSYTESVRLKRLPDAGVSRSPDARAGGDPDGAGAGAVEVDNLPPDPEGLSTDLPSAIGLSGFPADPSFLKPISSILPDPTVKELRAINKEYMSVLNEAKESMGSKAFMELVEKHLAYDEQSALIMAMKPWGSKIEYEFEEDKPAPEINSLKGQEIRNKLRPMVDAAARAAGWKIGVAYHGTDRVLTIFDPKKTGSDIVSTSTATNLTFFTPDVDSAREFGQNKVNHNVVESGKLAPPRSLEIIPVYLKVDKLFDPRKDWEKYSDLLYENRPNKDTDSTPIEEWIKKNKGNLANGHWNFWENQQVVDAVLREYDGMLISENGVATDVDGNFPVLDDNDMNIAVRDSRLIKSAAPVTLDEDFNLIPLEARFNPADERYIFSGVFGDESDLPSEFDADKVDYGNFIELLELPVAGAGSGFKLVKRQFAKMFVGETDPTVQKYARQRDAFLRTTEKMVEEYHDKYTAAIDKYYSSPDDVPWDLIQAAVGTLDNIDPDPDSDLQQAHIKRLDEIKARSRVVMSQEIEDAENQFAKDKENIAFIVREMRTDGNQTPEEIRKLGSESRKRLKEAKDRLNKRINEARKRADVRKGAATEIEEQSFKETLEKSRMANKQVALGGRDAALSELADTAPDLFTVIVDLRRLTDELSAKARDLFGRGGHDVIAKFDNNMGLYITRRYQMFSDSGYVKRILTSKEEKDVAVREAAIEFMRGQWIENKTDELMRENAGNREFTLQDAKDESYRLYTKSSNGGASLGFQMAAEFLNSWRGQGELTEAQDFASAFELAGMPKTVAPRMSGGLKAIVKNLKERSDIPKPLADLMGANNLPESSIDNLLYSFGTVAKIAAHQSFLEKMKQAGTQAETPWLLTAKQYNKALGENYSEFIEYKKILSTSADSGLNPLAGMYVHPDIYNSIRPMFQQTPRSGDDASSQLLHGSMRAAQLATGSAMGFKTLFSVGFFLRNMLGNVLFFGPAQGYWKAGKDIWSGDVGEGRGMSAWQGVRRALKGNKAATNAYLRELEGLDVFGNEVRSQIMLRLINGEETFDGVQEQIVNLQKKLSDKNLIKQGGAKYTSMMNTLARLASAMDSFYKIGYYENELAILRKAQEADRLLPPDQQTYANMSELELKQEAAEIVGDTAQSYSRALPIIKKISGSGWGLVFAPFIRFTAEVPRIVVNTYKRGFRDIRSKNPVMRRRGYNRVLWMTTIAGGLSMAVPTLLRSLLSEMGEDEDEAFRMSLPPYLRNHTFWLWKTDDGKIGSLDLTYLNPFSIIVDPLLRGMEHMVRGEPFTAVEKMTTAAILQPYLGEQILAGSIIDVMENRNAKTNMPIVESSQPLHIRMLNKLKYVGREAYGPRTPLKAIEAIRAGFGDAPESFADSPFGIVVYDSLPVRPRFYKPEDQFSRVVYQLRDEHRRAGRAFNELLTPKGMTEGAVEAVHKSVLSDRKRVNQKLMQAMRGMKGLGMTNQSIYGAMTAARYGDRRSKLLFAGFMENPVPTKNVTESLMRTAQGQQRLRTLMRAHGERERFLTVER